MTGGHDHPRLTRRAALRAWAGALCIPLAHSLVGSPPAWAAPTKPAASGTLTVNAESVRLDLRFDRDAGAFTLAGLNAFGAEWAQPGSGALWIDGLQADGGPVGLDGSGGLELVEQGDASITLSHPASGLRVALEYRAGPGSAVTHRAVLRNDRQAGPLRIGAASTLAWRLARGDEALALGTDDAPEAWSTVRRALPAELGNNGLRSGDDGAYPMIRLEAGGDGVIVAVSTATAWKVGLGLDGGARVVRAGEYSSDLTLGPGEEARLPNVVTIFYQGGEAGAVAALRRYLEGVSAPPPAGWPSPPAIFNTWFGYGTALLDGGDRDGELRRAARLAAEAGLEVFVVDAGWYLGSPVQDETAARNARRACAEGEAAECSTLDDFSRGLGTWVEEPSKWQAGLRGFSDFVHGLDVKRPDGGSSGKLRFGLWVEPERFDPTLDRPERVPGGWAIPGTAVLDFSRPEVVDGITARVQQAITAYGVDYLKIDANQVVRADASVGRSGHFWTRWSQGFERMLESLRTANPRLYLEHCASGLKRYWIGMPRLYHGSWLDDDVGFNTVGHLLDATDLLLLPRQKIVLATEDLTRYEIEPDDEHGEDTEAEAIAEMERIISAYWGRGNGGTIGFSSRIDRWLSRDSQPGRAASAAVATWKQTIRR